MGGWLSVGAGAEQGLESILKQKLEEAKLASIDEDRKSRDAENIRYHDQVERFHKDSLTATAAAKAATDDRQKAADEEKKQNNIRDDSRARFSALPPNTMVDEGERNQAVDSGGVAKAGFFNPGTLGMSSIDKGEVGPSDQSPGGSLFRGTTQAITANRNADISAQRAINQGDRIDQQGENEQWKRDNPKAPSSSTVVYQGVGMPPMIIDKNTHKATPVMGADNQPLPEKPTSVGANRQDMATKILNRFPDLESDLEDANRRGLLGPDKGRIADFLAGKVGSTGNGENDELLGSLRMNLNGVRSGFASLHGKGGGNVQIARDIEKTMDSGHMSYEELHGAVVRGMKRWVQDYAKNPNQRAAPAATDPYTEYLNRGKK